MITQEDLIDTLSVAIAAFPQYPLSKPQVEVYYGLLSDLEADKSDLLAALKVVLQTSKFFPTVAEIRAEILKKSTWTPPPFRALELINDQAVPMPGHVRELLPRKAITG